MIDHTTQYTVLKYLWTNVLFVSQAESESINATDLNNILLTFSCDLQAKPCTTDIVIRAYDLYEADLIEPSPSITVTDGRGTPVFWRLTEKAYRVSDGGPINRKAKWI